MKKNKIHILTLQKFLFALQWNMHIGKDAMCAALRHKGKYHGGNQYDSYDSKASEAV